MKLLLSKKTVRGISYPLLLSLMLFGWLSGFAQSLSTGEFAVLADGSPAMVGQTTTDHLFVRMDYAEAGALQTYDNVVSFKSGDVQTVWLWLDDDAIYLNEKVQALPKTLIKDGGAPYNEITYNSFQCDIYLPMSVQMIKTENEDGDEIMFVQGDRMPNSAEFTFGEKDFIKVIDGIQYRVYSLICSNKQVNGTHFSAKNATRYTNNGALKKDDAALIGIFLKNNNQSQNQGRLADMIIANQEFGMREPFIVEPKWEPNDYRFIYGTGGNNETQKFQKYNRVALFGSNGIEIKANGIYLNATQKSLNVGESYQLTATVTPTNATNKTVAWKSSNPSVATVDNNGNVTPLYPGYATITATTTDGTDLSASCDVVIDLATSISLDKTHAELIEGRTMQLIATVLPSSTPNKTVSWTTSDNSIVTVDSNGLLTAESSGSATITATTTDGSNLSATCSVTVYSTDTPQGSVIIFADANVKALCIQNWDENGDGELSEAEAAAVTSLNSVFRYKSTITSFNELEYFTGLTSIGNSAFYNCTNLTTITIPESVTSIGVNVFQGCSALTAITIPEGVTSISDGTFSGCSHLTSITIPESVSSIGGSAFYGCSNLTTITIPESVSFIGNSAFYNCSNLATITIPESVTSIANSVFYKCTNLTTITIPESVSSIGSYAFYGCSNLTTITIPESVSSIGSNAFSSCIGLSSITIPESVISIGNNAFSWCTHLTSITILEGVTSISDGIFSGCTNLTTITIPESVSFIGNSAFSGCTALKTLNYNAVSCNDFNSTELCPFQNLNISTIHIGDSVQRIPAYFAYGLTKLTDVTLPNTVTFIGKQAFDGAPAIESVTCTTATPPGWDDLAMFTANVYNHCPLYVPMGCVRAYQADECWGQFRTIIGIQDAVLATGLSLSQSQMNLPAGGTSQLIATVLPDSATNKEVSWMSSDPEIATVDPTGLVAAVAAGTATITATTTDGSNLSASCVVTVSEDLSDYDDYLSISDTEAFHGDTIVIPVSLTNTSSIISFQTDIYLPEGLELLQEDGEYLIDPSERMTRTHSIMSNAVSNGSIRVVCYSSNYKPFTGVSGDVLFYLTVKVADDAEGDYTVGLKNTLFTTIDFEELVAPDVAANVKVKAYLPGDANGSKTVTITDVVVTSQYILELNPQPFIFEAADVNVDGNITVTDVSRIAWMVLNPASKAPLLRAPALWNNGDLMRGNDLTLTAGETRRVSISLDNAMSYSAFQLDLQLPEGLTASNFALTDRACSHAFDVNTLHSGAIRALCYSPALTAIRGHEGALLTFDVTATGPVTGDISVDGIELVTTACQTVKLDGFTIGVNNASVVNELVSGKTIARVDYFNLAGQQIDRPESGVTLVVTTYTDGTRSVSKIIH